MPITSECSDPPSTMHMPNEIASVFALSNPVFPAPTINYNANSAPILMGCAPDSDDDAPGLCPSEASDEDTNWITRGECSDTSDDDCDSCVDKPPPVARADAARIR